MYASALTHHCNLLLHTPSTLTSLPSWRTTWKTSCKCGSVAQTPQSPVVRLSEGLHLFIVQLIRTAHLESTQWKVPLVRAQSRSVKAKEAWQLFFVILRLIFSLVHAYLMTNNCFSRESPSYLFQLNISAQLQFLKLFFRIHLVWNEHFKKVISAYFQHKCLHLVDLKNMRSNVGKRFLNELFLWTS